MAELSEQQQQTKTVPLTETSNVTDSEHEESTQLQESMDSLTLQDCVEQRHLISEEEDVENQENEVLRGGPNQNKSEEKDSANERKVIVKGGTNQNIAKEEEDAANEKKVVVKGKTNMNKEVATNEENLQRNTNQKISVEKDATIQKKVKYEGEPNNKAAEKSYYDNIGKRGLLCIIQDKDDKIFEKGNEKDREVLFEFFKKKLGFDFKVFDSYDDLDKKLEENFDFSSNAYYCLLICISGHGTKEGVQIGKQKLIQIEDIKERFGNERIPNLAGVPKIIILDACRGHAFNKTVSTDDLSKKKVKVKGGDNSVQVRPTTDSDFLIIHGTTHGRFAVIPDDGSVGIQGVMKVLNANWKNDHLEEMLIDAREEVAIYSDYSENKEIRQTLEIYTTLTKRMMFVKSKRET